MRTRHPRPSSPESQGRDEKGSAATPDAGLDWCCDSRHPCRSSDLATGSVPCRMAAGGSGTFRPGEDVTHFESRRRRCEVANGSRLSHLFQEEMMHMTQGWTGLRTAVIALGLFACASAGARADSILTYSTAGSIDTVTKRRCYRAQHDQLCPDHECHGRRQLEHLPGRFPGTGQSAGQSTTYNNTPFSITYSPASIDGNAGDRARPRLTGS